MTTMGFNVSVATVTYGDRGHLVTETVARALNAGARHATVVLNGASPQTAPMLARFGNLVTLVDLGKNTGSAGGFAAAIEALKARGEDDGLLLDDDNWLSGNAIAQYVDAYQAAMEISGGEKRVALAAYHAANTSQAAVVAGRAVDDAYPICVRGSIEGFDVCRKLRGMRPGGARLPEEVSEAKAGLVEIPLAPYGGLFLARPVLNTCGSPRMDFVLYNDDYEFTRRLSRSGVRIYLVPEVSVEEADGKVASTNGESYLSVVMGTPSSERWRVLYRLRNAAFLYRGEAQESRAMLRFAFNMLARLTLILAFAIRRRQLSFGLAVARAHLSGFSGRLGVRYPLPESTYTQS